MRITAVLLAVLVLGFTSSSAGALTFTQTVTKVALSPDTPMSATPDPLPAPVPYRGLGTWVDIYDGRVFDAPEAAVRSMATRGVKTIYVETGNSGSKSSIFRPADMARLIRAAHRRKMKVVAWYLPTLRTPSRDLYRCVQAIRFKTRDGHRFDSFALDIESSAVKPVSERNRRLIWLSRKIRSASPSRYPLGAIIPSPVGMDLQADYWQPFPYEDLIGSYDVILPMTYYTYRWDGEQAVYDSMTRNVYTLRSKPGYETVPVHLIGGLASRSSAAEVRAFVTVANETKSAGASLYDWTTMKYYHWPELAKLGR